MKNIDIYGETMKKLFKPKAMQSDKLAQKVANMMDSSFSFGKGSVNVGLRRKKKGV